MKRFLLACLICSCAFAQIRPKAIAPVIDGSDPSANAPAPPPVKPEDKCSLEGTVLNSATGEPLKKAQIILRKMAEMGSPAAGAATDAAGRFSIKDVDPGRYLLLAGRNGFVQQAYGAKGANRGGGSITLDPGQNMKDLTFRLVPQGVIVGRVVDEDGEPLANVMIQCQHHTYVRGRRQLAPAGSVSTNDLGEYRMHGLAPGKYYMSASFYVVDAILAAGPQGPTEESYGTAYYPNATGAESAAAVQVTPGAQVRGIDMTLVRRPAARVRGRMVSGITTKPVRNANLFLAPKDDPGAGFMGRNFARNFDNKGGFELHGVLPGSYALVGDIFEDGHRLSARVPLEVGAANVDGVVVSFNLNPDITGKVVVEGNADIKGAALNIRLDPNSPVPMGGYAGGPVTNDSTFRLQNVGPSTFQVNITGLQENFYVKTVRFGDADITDSGLDFTQGVQVGDLSVMISPNGGQVDGNVENAKGDPASAVTVVLIPDVPRRQLNRYYKTSATDQNGHFTLKGIPPGEYKLLAWEQVDFGVYQDPDFLKPFESSGESVSISEKSHETKHLKAIPAEATQN